MFQSQYIETLLNVFSVQWLSLMVHICTKYDVKVTYHPCNFYYLKIWGNFQKFFPRRKCERRIVGSQLGDVRLKAGPHGRDVVKAGVVVEFAQKLFIYNQTHKEDTMKAA